MVVAAAPGIGGGGMLGAVSEATQAISSVPGMGGGGMLGAVCEATLSISCSIAGVVFRDRTI